LRYRCKTRPFYAQDMLGSHNATQRESALSLLNRITPLQSSIAATKRGLFRQPVDTLHRE
jgi:hypothetical protein